MQDWGQKLNLSLNLESQQFLEGITLKGALPGGGLPGGGLPGGGLPGGVFLEGACLDLLHLKHSQVKVSKVGIPLLKFEAFFLSFLQNMMYPPCSETAKLYSQQSKPTEASKLSRDRLHRCLN